MSTALLCALAEPKGTSRGRRRATDSHRSLPSLSDESPSPRSHCLLQSSNSVIQGTASHHDELQSQTLVDGGHRSSEGSLHTREGDLHSSAGWRQRLQRRVQQAESRPLEVSALEARARLDQRLQAAGIRDGAHEHTAPLSAPSAVETPTAVSSSRRNRRRSTVAVASSSEGQGTSTSHHSSGSSNSHSRNSASRRAGSQRRSILCPGGRILARPTTGPHHQSFRHHQTMDLHNGEMSPLSPSTTTQVSAAHSRSQGAAVHKIVEGEGGMVARLLELNYCSGSLTDIGCRLGKEMSTAGVGVEWSGEGWLVVEVDADEEREDGQGKEPCGDAGSCCTNDRCQHEQSRRKEAAAVLLEAPGHQKSAGSSKGSRSASGAATSNSSSIGRDDHLVCPVCLDPLLCAGLQLFCLPCSHTFHSRCVQPWLLRHQSCPYCRSKVFSHELLL